MRRTGFSLIETIFATFILSLVIMMVFNLYPSSMLAVQRAEQQMQADSVAQSLLETQRTAAFSSLGSPGTTESPGARTIDGVRYTPTVEYFRPSTVTADDRMRGVRVTVTWENRHKVRSVTHETWITNVKR